jgi:hypothetical protein
MGWFDADAHNLKNVKLVIEWWLNKKKNAHTVRV